MLPSSWSKTLFHTGLSTLACKVSCLLTAAMRRNVASASSSHPRSRSHIGLSSRLGTRLSSEMSMRCRRLGAVSLVEEIASPDFGRQAQFVLQEEISTAGQEDGQSTKQQVYPRMCCFPSPCTSTPSEHALESCSTCLAWLLQGAPPHVGPRGRQPHVSMTAAAKAFV